MLPYCQQFCNSFPASSPSVWQRAWAAWRPLSPTSLARIRRLLQTACRTPRRLSTPHLHVARTYPPTQHSATRMWWTLQSVSPPDNHASTRRHQPHVLAVPAYLRVPDCSAAIAPEHRGVVRLACRGLGRRPPWFEETPSVVWGDALRGLRRRPPWFEETIIMITYCYINGLSNLTVKKTVKKTTHTRSCV